MRVLLISTYELGHQPLHVASPAAALRRAGHEVRCLDLSVQPWDAGALQWTQAVGFSVPMHTAMRLALRRLVDEDSRGDPESLLRWSAQSVRQIAGALREMGHVAHFTSVALFLQLLWYSLQANV